MKYALHLTDDGRVLAITEEPYEGAILVDSYPDGDTYDYRYVDGVWIYDPLPVVEPVAEPTADDVLNALLGVTV